MDLTPLLGPRTGVGQVVSQLATRLADERSLDLTGLVVSWRGRGRLPKVVPPGWAVRPLAAPARLAHGLWRRVDWPRISGYDVVHGPNYTVPPVPPGVARLVTVHDLTAWRFPELVDRHSRNYPAILARAVATGAHVHAVSAYVGRELEQELGIDPDRIHVIPNGLVPVAGGEPARARSLVGGPYVLALGTIEPRKDHVTLVRAMADVWPVLPDLKLAVAGGDGWARPELDELVDELGVGDRIRFLGYVDEQTRADLLAGAELLAYPSIYEGFGLPILEAMQAGVPVVSTSAGAIPEVAGRAAVLVEPQDPTALAGALLAVLEDDVVRSRMIEAGRDRSGGQSWDRSVELLAQTYHRLAAESR